MTVRDYPIIFSAPMVQALIRELKNPGSGKTQTRRLLYTNRKARGGGIPADAAVLQGHRTDPRTGEVTRFTYHPPIHAPDFDTYWALTGWHKRKPGDRLWVRENFRHHREPEKLSTTGVVEYLHYKATDEGDFLPGIKWTPSIHMPRQHSRLTLTITATKIERLQDISHKDATAEGIMKRPDPTLWTRPYGVPGADPQAIDGFGYTSVAPAAAFARLWIDLHGTESWDDNPWVVALTFTVALQNIDQAAA